MSTVSFPPPLRGTVQVPGDKSLSHRAVLFASMAEGRSHLVGVLASEDVRSTIRVCRALGAHIEADDESGEDFGSLSVLGWGERGPHEPAGPLDCGNSGTTARLLMGVLAGWPIDATLIGDASLSKRPMARVVDPLEAMGALFKTTPHGTLPVTVRGSSDLIPAHYASPVASAQVKTAVLLAGLRASGPTSVSEPYPSRDHTERLLPAFGVLPDLDPVHGVTVYGPTHLYGTELAVPGDPSSAAFLVVAALLIPGSEITLSHVSLNPTRIGFLRVIERMGADVSFDESESAGLEPVGSICAAYSPVMSGTTVTAAEVPSLIDEIPILALAAACASGTTRFEGVGELRVKESDRLSAIADGLEALGVVVRAGADWLEVDGTRELSGATLHSLGDHRLAMTWAVAAQIAQGETEVSNMDAMAVSYPGFLRDLRKLMNRGTP
ncbi:MAG: 3-phosphoshikimate 1-carboxyvinyltransferase [Coriobacteriia bacterium]|nr:3-phosphoshikimate 1-carboxyvinyltransferase [Coriobacteriia bacterium]